MDNNDTIKPWFTMLLLVLHSLLLETVVLVCDHRINNTELKNSISTLDQRVLFLKQQYIYIQLKPFGLLHIDPGCPTTAKKIQDLGNLNISIISSGQLADETTSSLT